VKGVLPLCKTLTVKFPHQPEASLTDALFKTLIALFAATFSWIKAYLFASIAA
jgi:hypothetical protein